MPPRKKTEELNGNGEYKLSVEGRLTSVEVNTNTILTNHLPHLDAKVDAGFERIERRSDVLEGKVDDLSLQIARWGGAIGAVTVLMQLILKYVVE